MELYSRKVSEKGKVSYVPYQRITEIHLNNKQLLTLVATITTCLMIGFEQELKEHSAVGRKIREVENSIQSLSKLIGTSLDAEMVDIGIDVWQEMLVMIADRTTGDTV